MPQTDENDFDRINTILDDLKAGKFTQKRAANALLQILIDISGERLRAIDQAKYDVYEALLTNGMIKPEFTKQVYEAMRTKKKENQ